MRWSWKLGRVSGIRIQVHWTFLILIAWVIVVHVARGANLPAIVGGVLLVLAVFACVILHELGHALTARRFGISTRDITLLPIGGVARLERMPTEPRQELLVAAAGPAVNVAIAALLFLGLALGGALRPVQEIAVVGGNLPSQLLWVNVMLVGFNLLPAFPMDGGRILRALLAYRLDYARSTRVAATVGQGMAIVFGFLGLIGPNPFLVFIAIFVYLGAQAESRQVQMRTALDGVTVGDAMMTRYRVLEGDNTLGQAIEALLAGAQQDFPVIEGDRIVGLLTRATLVAAVKDKGPGTPVGDVVEPNCPVASEDDELRGVLSRMREAKCQSVPVLRGNTLVGLLTLENVGELLMIGSDLRDAARRIYAAGGSSTRTTD
ncbi:MAG: site-2 protease family protein [Gemmatimonadota bacterium]|nr:site-2 protease family protein [Gemmatimonadota bacterium]MDH3366403.1 site-2 protease family protein [Gemmatimonadota bacterium]MDH3477589.1 site-2 protease family protein [Gemmatimonadota bacterium]MDH3568602.1 site-2 protease family protein [Gemmatimonadota bacterium]MDH5548680.1 site-2 protease family protein [Gemmatimonadota bacterium]